MHILVNFYCDISNLVYYIFCTLGIFSLNTTKSYSFFLYIYYCYFCRNLLIHFSRIFLKFSRTQIFFFCFNYYCVYKVSNLFVNSNKEQFFSYPYHVLYIHTVIYELYCCQNEFIAHFNNENVVAVLKGKLIYFNVLKHFRILYSIIICTHLQVLFLFMSFDLSGVFYQLNHLTV